MLSIAPTIRARIARSPARRRLMRCSARSLVVVLVGFAASASVVGASEVGASETEELDRWVPAVAFEVDVFAHTGKGNLDGTQVTGPRKNVSPQEATQFGDFRDSRLTDPKASRGEIISALIGGNFEVMSPRLVEGFGHPRIFLDVSVFATQTSEVRLARDANPGEMSLPPTSEGRRIGEGAIVGRGSQVSIQHKDPQVHSGIGVAFTHHFETATVRIKPSFTYSRIPVSVTTATRRAFVQQRPPSDPSPYEIDDPNDYRLLILDDSRDEVYHGAGGAVEIEYETGERIGPFDITIYLKGAFTRLWGDLTTEITGTNPDYPGEQIFYKYSQDRWVYRGGTGIRFRFVGDSTSKKRR